MLCTWQPLTCCSGAYVSEWALALACWKRCRYILELHSTAETAGLGQMQIRSCCHATQYDFALFLFTSPQCNLGANYTHTRWVAGICSASPYCLGILNMVADVPALNWVLTGYAFVSAYGAGRPQAGLLNIHT